MGKVNVKNISLKKSFVYMVIITVGVILISSALSVYGCLRLQKILLPDSQEVWLHVETINQDGSVSEIKQRISFMDKTQLITLLSEGEKIGQNTDKSYTIEKINNSYAMLTPTRKASYQLLTVAMIILPGIYALVGVTLCGWYFYRKKLEPPLKILSSATENISNHNLEFSIFYDSNDELGQLCDAFEKMRHTLYDNNRELWSMVEERKELQASVAHDLRNPIAIIKGYAEYMEQCTRNGKINLEKISDISVNLITVAKRMERYTDSIKQINNLEQMHIQLSNSNLPALLDDIAKDFAVVALQNKIKFGFDNTIKTCEVRLDKQAVLRILENVYMNAIRYAKSKIIMRSYLKNDILTMVIEDDGDGFSDDVLNNNGKKIIFQDEAGEHSGLGLTISRILSKKHGGSCEINNLPYGGAVVSIIICVNEV